MNLTSGVAAVSPTPEVRAAASAADAASAAAIASHSSYADSPYASYAVADAAASAAYASAAAAYAANAYVANASAADAAAEAAAYAANAAAEAAPFIWDHIRWDAGLIEQGRDPFAVPLWTNPTPEWFEDADAETQVFMRSDPTLWDFWQRWWNGVKSGNQLDWALQEQVALIPNDIWKSGPGPVAEAIAEIELHHAIARTPNAEVLRLNPATGLIRAEPVSHLSGSHLDDIVDTLLDASAIFDDAGGPNGPYGSLAGECDLITDAATRYRHRPLMLLRICQRVVDRTRIKEAAGEIPRNDALVGDFIGSIAGAVGDLLAFDSDVQEAETARAKANPALPSPEMSRALILAADQSALISEGDLATELPIDARLVGSDAPEGQRAVALYQTRSRLLRILSILRSNGKGAVEHYERYSGVYGALLTITLFLIALG